MATFQENCTRVEEVSAALDRGTVLRLALHADGHGHSAEASVGRITIPPIFCPSECIFTIFSLRVQEADKWLRMALDGGMACASVLQSAAGTCRL